MSSSKNPERVAAGLKSTLNKSNVSEEAKTRASERLQEMGAASETSERDTSSQPRQFASGSTVDDAPPVKGAVNKDSGPEIVEDAPVPLDDDDEWKPQGDVLAHEPEDDKYEYGKDDF
ncbi:conidiation-specific protein 6 [Moniliophthora roreri MCA 2997]|uniref:Conidiation-specific protein 6 n=1 Tax=Moniliophthora roreri (strain MCA 2997) TaxID=1381753 RepID=V2X6E7_MONRO|nr:conidiation-specific protein 6 [Moniliophthora roreri MCA 2997]